MHHHAHPAVRIHERASLRGARTQRSSQTLSLLSLRCTSPRDAPPRSSVRRSRSRKRNVDPTSRRERDPLSLMLCCGLARSSIARRGISLALRARMCESESEPSKLLQFLARYKVHSERAASPRACCSPVEKNLGESFDAKERRLCCKYIDEKGLER